MTTPDLRAALAALGLSQRGLGRVLGVDERTVRRWVQDAGAIPPTVHRVLAVAIAHPELVDWLRGA